MYVYCLGCQIYCDSVRQCSLQEILYFCFFQFWNIVPLEQLLAQLEVEQSAAVIRRLVKLLVNSFHPTNKSVDVQVS